ncbi:MAG TPA: hypothetical protein VFG12_03945, partial [Rhodopila sp.]|nr:hypothetical protein [Rhodopila sp.]
DTTAPLNIATPANRIFLISLSCRLATQALVSNPEPKRHRCLADRSGAVAVEASVNSVNEHGRTILIVPCGEHVLLLYRHIYDIKGKKLR